MNKLEETDLMPYGVWEGKPLNSIPIQYFRKLWNDGLYNVDDDPVAVFIREHKEEFEKRTYEEWE